MATAITTYTQTDLNKDISAITDSIESVIYHVGRVKDNWAQIQSLHPGVTAVEYICDRVPYLHRNTAAAVALVEAGTTSVSDAARLTGRAQSTVSEAVAKTSIGKPMDTSKPTTLATGATAPGPAIGTKKEEPAPIAVPVISGLPPAPVGDPAKIGLLPPSPLAEEAYRLLKQVAELDYKAARLAMNESQSRRLVRVSKKAEKVCSQFTIPTLFFP